MFSNHKAIISAANLFLLAIFNKKGILFKSPDPTLKCYKGCQDSCCQNISADPILENDKNGNPAKWIQVWSRGQWNKKGPWQEKIKILLGNLIEELVQAKNKAQKELERKEEESKLQEKKEREQLINNWS